MRSEAYQRADFEAQNARTFRLDTKKTMDAMSSKVAVLERSLSSFPHIEGKLNAIDKRINEMEASQVNALLDNRVANQALDERINKLDAVKDELIALVESTRAGLSRVTFDVEDNNTRVNNYMSNIESRVNATMQASKEDILRELSSLQAKSTNQIDEVKKSIELRNLEILNVTKKQYTALGEELDASRRKWSQELDGLGVHLKEDADRRVQKAQHSLHQTIQQLHSAQTEQAGFMCDIEQTFLGQLEGVHTSMRDIAQHQQAVEEKVATAQSTQKDLESRMQELQTSISMSSPIRHSVGNWAGGHSGTPPRSFVAHNYDISNPTGNVSAQAGPDARMFPHTSDLPPSFPMSPVPHGGDTSFAFAPDMRNISGMTGAPSVPGVPCIPAGSYPPAYGYPQSTFAQHSSNDREFQQAAAPLNTDSRASQEPRRSTRTKSPSATSVNRREGINVRMPLRSTSPNLAACSSLRRSTGSVPRQSLSQSRSQSQGRGGAGPIRSASLSPGRTVRRQQQQQPSVDGAEVIQRFMEMFQADKQEIAQRYAPCYF